MSQINILYDTDCVFKLNINISETFVYCREENTTMDFNVKALILNSQSKLRVIYI